MFGRVILLLSVVVCTFTAQVYFNPYQALISDLCRTEEATSRGFSVFVMLVNLGSIVSSLLFSWNWFSGDYSDFRAYHDAACK